MKHVLLFLVLLLTCKSAPAQEIKDLTLSPDGVLNSLTLLFIDNISEAATPIKEAANRLFWILVPISIVMLGIKSTFKDGNMQSFMGDLVKLLLVTGFYYFLLDNGTAIGHSVIDSLTSVTTNSNTGPSELIDLTFNIASNLNQNISAGLFNAVTGFILRCMVLVFMFIMFLVVIKFTTLFICAHILCICGVFVLGLGAISYTRYIAINFFKSILSMSLELMTTLLVINSGCLILKNLKNKSQEIVESGSSVGSSECSVIIFTALFIYILSKYLPEAVSNLVTMTNGRNAKRSNSRISLKIPSINLKK